MALVRISKKLLDDVAKSIKQVSEKAYAAAVESKNPGAETSPVVEELFEAGLKDIWKKAPYLQAELPAEWCSTTSRMDLSVRFATHRHKVIITRPVRCPPNATSYGYMDAEVMAGDLSNQARDAVSDFFVSAEEHKQKYNQVEEQIKKFLTASKSLNAALKEFPSLALYIPDNYLISVQEVTRRTAAKAKEQAPPVEIDKELITSTGVLGKLQE